MAHDVFISHSTKDRDVTEKVCRALEDAGYEYWVSFEDIPPGASWTAFITEAITAAPVMVVILTANSNTSKQVSREVELADKNESPPTTLIFFQLDDIRYNGASRISSPKRSGCPPTTRRPKKTTRGSSNRCAPPAPNRDGRAGAPPRRDRRRPRPRAHAGRRTVYSQGCRETAVRLASRPGVTAVHDKMAGGRSLLPEKILCSEQ